MKCQFLGGVLSLCFVLASGYAQAACSPAPISTQDDMVLRFTANQGVWAGSASMMETSILNTATNVEGVVVYDAANKTLKLCDGLNWQALSGMTGITAAAGNQREIQFNDGNKELGADSHFTWDKDKKSLSVGTHLNDASIHLQGLGTKAFPHIKLTNDTNNSYSILANSGGLRLSGETNGSPTGDYYIGIENTANQGYSKVLYGIISTAVVADTASPTRINSVLARPYLRNSATIPNMTSYAADIYAYGPEASGHITEYAAFEAMPVFVGGGATATFGTTYGLLLRPRQHGAIKYGVYQAGTDESNVFMGSVGIGTTTPQSRLDVAGGIKLGNDTAPCPGTGNAKLGTMRFSAGSYDICLATGWNTLSTTGQLGIAELTGDVTASGSGSAVATIADNAITSAKIADGTIVAADLANNAVTTAKITNSAVSYAKIQNVTGSRLLGRAAATAGPVGEISVGSGLSLSTAGVLTATGDGQGITALTGDITASGSGSVAATIANNAITSAKIADGTIVAADLANNAVATAKIANSAVSNAKLANMPAATVKGNSGTGAAVPADLTMAILRGMLGSGTPNNSNFLRGDGQWASPSSGGGGPLGVRLFTSNGTYTRGTGVTRVLVIAQAAGGRGGAYYSSGDDDNNGGGGGSGETRIGVFSPAATVAVTVGAAGTTANTSFGTHMVAGRGLVGGNGSKNSAGARGGRQAGSGGVLLGGAAASPAYVGGSTIFGSGTAQGATGYGSGGVNGSNGAPGFVLVIEF